MKWVFIIFLAFESCSDGFKLWNLDKRLQQIEGRPLEMRPKDRMVAQLAKDNADAAWKMFFEDGHSENDYEFFTKVIDAAMSHWNTVRFSEQEEDDHEDI